jgi:hypothetical protein
MQQTQQATILERHQTEPVTNKKSEAIRLTSRRSSKETKIHGLKIVNHYIAISIIFFVCY